MILILAFFLIRAVSSRPEECFTSACDSSQQQIRFPFRLPGIQPDRCGYRGFDLSCDGSRTTILRLGNSSLSVQNIDYANQQIWLNDPNQCLPRLLLTLDLTGTPFRAVYPEEFALFNCSSNSSLPSGYEPVSCLGDVNGRSYNVVATAVSAPLSGAASCALMKIISVPASWPWSGNDGRSSVVPDDGIRLAWDEPRCGGCENKGGFCGLKPGSDHDVQCRIPGELSRYVQRITTIAIGFLIVIALFVILKICKFDWRSDPNLNSWLEFNSTVNPPLPIRSPGLDRRTIESFPITVLGESIRISKTENNVCAICLGEYKPKETLRTVPACHHFFHANCIDEWLLRNPTCPICRESQIMSPELARAPGP